MKRDSYILEFKGGGERTHVLAYFSCCMKVEERLVPDAERLLGLVNLAHLNLLRTREDDFFLYTQQPSAEVTLTHWLALQKKQSPVHTFNSFHFTANGLS